MDIFEIVREFWWAVILSALAIVFIISAWDKIRWKAMSFKYGFPIIGKSASLSRNTQIDKHNKGWLKSERDLCADYQKFIGLQNKTEFERNISYLNKSGDTGRNTTPPFVWLLIIGLVIAEALGFSYVLAGYAVPGASEQIQLYGSIIIAFVISILLVWFTHLSGTELFLNSVISAARESWNNLGQKGPLSQGIDVDISQNDKDDDQPSYAQTLHRTRKKKVTYPITIFTAFLVIIVALGSTYIRSTVLEQQIIDEVTGTQNYYFQGVPEITGIPGDLQEKADKSTTEATDNTHDLERKGGWTTFIILSVLFVFIQILGVIFGYKWGFAGKQSKDAYTRLGRGRFCTYDDVLQHKENVIDEAQARLESLQQKLEKNNANSGSNSIKTHKTFEDYLFEKAENKHESKQKHDSIGSTANTEKALINPETDVVTLESNTQDDEILRLEAQIKAKKIDDLKRQMAELERSE